MHIVLPDGPMHLVMVIKSHNYCRTRDVNDSHKWFDEPVSKWTMLPFCYDYLITSLHTLRARACMYRPLYMYGIRLQADCQEEIVSR